MRKGPGCRRVKLYGKGPGAILLASHALQTARRGGRLGDLRGGRIARKSRRNAVTYRIWGAWNSMGRKSGGANQAVFPSDKTELL